MQVLLQIILIVVVKFCENLIYGTQRKCNEKDYSQSYPYKEK